MNAKKILKIIEISIKIENTIILGKEKHIKKSTQLTHKKIKTETTGKKGTEYPKKEKDRNIKEK